jgi:putative ABC transport system substrate-binding protein
MVVGAQQGDRVRRIGVLMGADENDPQGKTIVSAFTQALAGLGWTDGRNVRLDIRWALGLTIPETLLATADEVIQ